jgi:diguanylate cyclase (GGDEF)-like protein
MTQIIQEEPHYYIAQGWCKASGAILVERVSTQGITSTNGPRRTTRTRIQVALRFADLGSMRHPSFAGKMALIGVVFLIPVTLLIALLYLQIDRDVAFYRLERIGVTYTRALRPLFADLEALRLTQAMDAAQRRAIDADFVAAHIVDAGPGRELLLSRPLQALNAKWRATPRATGTLDDVLVLLGLVSDNSKITLDPILDGYYVGDTLVNKIPSLIDSTAQVDVLANRWVRRGSLSGNDRISMTIESGQVIIAREGIDHNLGIALVVAPYLGPSIAPAQRAERAATSDFTLYLAANFLKPSAPHASGAELTRHRAATLQAAFALYDTTLDGMADVLDRRIVGLRRHETEIFTIVFVAVVVAAGLMIATTRSMARHIADKVSLQQEIVGRIAVEERLAYTAFHDELTGLSNRALLMDRLNHFAAKRESAGRMWAILFIDLDRFKVVNDSLGHKAGDLVLIEASRRLERCVRTGDTLARLGGDEFVIVLDDIDDVDQAFLIAQRTLDSFEAPFIVAGQEIFASASIGIATSLVTEEPPEDVLRNADIAMYRAKQLGKQRCELFSPELLTSAVLRLELETDLARALERNEFLLYYQPLVSMQGNCLAGFEALVRWDHPRRGLVNPDEFISLAEENGMIVPIGAWVLNEACRQLQLWRTEIPAAVDLRMNINVSGKQLASPDFLPVLDHALTVSGLPADRVNIEITESVLMENAERTRSTLTQIRRRGARIHLDDFGTGYSSLSYLRNFPIDSLKIDRSFVSAAGDTASSGLASEEIVRTIIGLAHSLSLTVTGEGTETLAQVEALRDLGCTTVQGYHFSRPVASGTAAGIIAAGINAFVEAAQAAGLPR